ncbi:hypothetical protein DKX38_013721 [Salix brachista]|uniref:Uncharacterized protein n=1 Tax=Salix brachista TaxID=2182728 RepID=A0A5N5LDJ2_9ROSI|nr:hypothetical protein DKX38_013721 [Salix brachista]
MRRMVGMLWETSLLDPDEVVDLLFLVADYVFKAIDALPITAHPMTEFATSVMALQVQSEFQKAYEKGIHKSKYWEPMYEDSLSLIA